MYYLGMAGWYYSGITRVCIKKNRVENDKKKFEIPALLS